MDGSNGFGESGSGKDGSDGNGDRLGSTVVTAPVATVLGERSAGRVGVAEDRFEGHGQGGVGVRGVAVGTK